MEGKKKGKDERERESGKNMVIGLLAVLGFCGQ